MDPSLNVIDVTLRRIVAEGLRRWGGSIIKIGVNKMWGQSRTSSHVYISDVMGRVNYGMHYRMQFYRCIATEST